MMKRKGASGRCAGASRRCCVEQGCGTYVVVIPIFTANGSLKQHDITAFTCATYHVRHILRIYGVRRVT